MSELDPTFEALQLDARDAFLYTAWKSGWANESSGDINSPLGRFALINNEPDDVPEMVDALWEEYVLTGLEDPTLLIGNYLIVQDHKGWKLTSYHSPTQSKAEYRLLQMQYRQYLIDMNASWINEL